MKTLLTKDGRNIGNAIIIKEVTDYCDLTKSYLEKTNQKLWLVETDFGNRVRLCDREIDEWFNEGQEQDYAQWAEQRDELRKQYQFKDQHPEPDPS